MIPSRQSNNIYVRTLSKYLCLAVILLVCGCAKQGMPTGGSKDETPPKALRTQPANRSLGFNEKSFFIEFDEYVVLKDADNNILVSPPMKNKPEYKTKGHGIQVKLNDTLRENTTYLFQFKDAIADFNEGNLLPSFEYVFSTGSYIDSMTLSGRAVDAQSQNAREEAVSVWLYTDEQHSRLLAGLTDTAVDKVTPSYITRCDKQGKFSFNNIRPGRYHIVAVVDEDKNMQPGLSEAIAFTDTTVAALPMRDSTATDSTKNRLAVHPPLNLQLFSPRMERQRITSSQFKSAGKAVVTSLLPMTAPSVDGGGEETVWRLNATRDTLTVWTLREKCDSLRLVVSDASGIQDTLKLRWRAPKSRPQQITTAATQALSATFNHKSLPYFDTLALTVTTPLNTAKCRLDSAATVMNIKDSSMMACTMTIDSTAMRVLLSFPTKQGEKYRVRVDKGTLHDIYGHTNDTLNAVVTVTNAEEYGNLHVKLAFDSLTTPSPTVVELLNEKGTVISSRKLDAPGDARFPHLTPGKYRVRAIVDSNGNGKWDTGDFAERQQPERVVFLPKTLDIRANWEFEEELLIKN